MAEAAGVEDGIARVALASGKFGRAVVGSGVEVNPAGGLAVRVGVPAWLVAVEVACVTDGEGASRLGDGDGRTCVEVGATVLIPTAVVTVCVAKAVPGVEERHPAKAAAMNNNPPMRINKMLRLGMTQPHQRTYPRAIALEKPPGIAQVIILLTIDMHPSWDIVLIIIEAR